MLSTRCHLCGAELGGPDVSAFTTGHLIGHIQDTNSVPTLHALSRFIQDAYPTDEAAPRLTGVILTKVARLLVAN